MVEVTDPQATCDECGSRMYWRVYDREAHRSTEQRRCFCGHIVEAVGVPTDHEPTTEMMTTIQSENYLAFGVDYARKIGPNAALERTPDGIGMDAYPWRILIAFENGSYYTYLSEDDLVALTTMIEGGHKYRDDVLAVLDGGLPAKEQP